MHVYAVFKTLAFHLAAREDHPDQWTCNDIEAARCWANHHRGTDDILTPAEVYHGFARPISDQQHTTFQTQLELEYIRRLHQLDAPVDPRLTRVTIGRDVLDRQSIVAALMSCDLLTIRRKRFHQPVPEPKVA